MSGDFTPHRSALTPQTPPEPVFCAAYRCGHTISPNFSVSIVIRSRHQGLGLWLGEFSSTTLKFLEEKPTGRSRAREISERPCFSSPTLFLLKQTMFPAIAISQGLSKQRFPSLMVSILCLKAYFRVWPISPKKNPKSVNFCTRSLRSSRLVLRVWPADSCSSLSWGSAKGPASRLAVEKTLSRPASTAPQPAGNVGVRDTLRTRLT